MARLIEDFPNITAPDSDYPLGSLLDRAGLVAGTPLRKETLDDIFQFFSQLMTIAGGTITVNHLPDNYTQGGQWEHFR